MLRYLRLLRLFIRTELQFALEYRTNLALDILQTVVVVATSVAAVLVLFHYTEAMNGWTLAQMLVLLGVFYVVQGAEELVLQPSLQRFMEHVRMGTLDFALLKPANSQFLVSFRHYSMVQVAQVALGLALVGIGLARLGESVTLASALSFAIMLAAGLVLVYSLLLVLSTLSFWFVRVENLLAIFWSFVDAGRFPVNIYPGWLRVTLSTVVPIGVAVTVPAQAAAGTLDMATLIAVGAGAIGAWLFASWFWRVGLRTYTGASA